MDKVDHLASLKSQSASTAATIVLQERDVSVAAKIREIIGLG